MKPHFVTMLALALSLAPAAFAHNGDGGSGMSTQVSPNLHCWQIQNPHDYQMVYSTPADWKLGPLGSGLVVIVGDHNMEDCDMDGQGFDYDGDMEYGFGGGRFIIDTPDYACRPPQEIAHHGRMIAVIDDIQSTVKFSVGADPSPFSTPCQTDGAITPAMGDDDWLMTCVDSCTIPPTFAPGPGGEIWVFVHPPAAQGHIYSS